MSTLGENYEGGAGVAESAGGTESLPGQLQELRELVVGYAKQETVDPLKQLGRFVLFGMLGSLVLGIGVVLLLLGLLRLLQTETGTAFQGNWSWVPYFAVLAGCGIVIALAMFGLARGQRRPGAGGAASVKAGPS